MLRSSKILLLALLLATAAACGGADDDGNACDDVTCLEGTTCIVQDSGPACIPD
jgi:hypothetical protein